MIPVPPLVPTLLSACLASVPNAAGGTAAISRGWAADARPPGVWLAQARDDDDDEEDLDARSRSKRRPFLGSKSLKRVLKSPLRVPSAARVSQSSAADRTEAAAQSPSSPRSSSPPARAQDVSPPAGASAAQAQPSRPAPTNAAAIDFDQRKNKGKFSFEFAKAEIVDIVKAISEMTRKNFIIPDKLKSKRLTILSPTKISAAEAYRVFYSALASNDITIVRVGKFHKLINAKDAVKQTIPTCVGPDEDCRSLYEQMVTVIVHLRHTDASQINAVIKSLVSKEGQLTIFQPTNALIISEYAPNLARVRRIIEALDVPGFDDELRIVQIQYATAAEIADKLTQIFEVQGSGRSAGRASGRSSGTSSARRRGKDKGSDGDDGGEEVSISKIIPDDRTNQIIIKAHRRSFEAIEGLIAKLDVPISESEQGKVHVHYLENASAEELASTLQSLAQGSGSTQRRPASAARAKGSTPSTQRPTSAVLFEGEVSVTADKSTNSLVIVASAHDYRALRGIIEKLDVPRRQVYVEVAVLEVTVKDDEEYAFDWHTPLTFKKNQLGGYGGGNSLGFMQSAGGSPTIGALATPTALLEVAGGSVAGVIGKGVDIPGTDTGVQVPSFGVLLQWLQTSSNANILSTPHILTTDNEEASIEVGQKIPFRRGTSFPGYGGGGGLGSMGSMASSMGGAVGNIASSLMGGYGGMFSATDRIDVSLKLTLTPQINERDKIRLEIDQQIEDLVGKEEMTGQPITANRATKTVVVVDDQQTVVLGGLMRDRATDSESKFPILGDLPIFGWLFKQRSTQVEKVNLLLVLTPYIIDGSRDFQRIFERKMKEHEEFAADYYGDRPDYRAHVDYARKSGPFAHLASAVARQRSRYENGGDGDGTEIMVGPRPPESPAEPSSGDEEGAGAPPGLQPTAPAPPEDEPTPAPGAEPAAEER